MSYEFAVGKRVICIAGGTRKQISGPRCMPPSAWPQHRCIYTIRAIFDNRDGTVGFHLEEVINPPDRRLGVEPTFNSARFRPVRDTDISVFTQLLEKPPAKELEKA